MISVNIAEAKAKFSYYVRLASSGETVQVCERNRPVAKITAVAKPYDRALRESGLGMFAGLLSEAELDEALRPMTDEEADAFLEGTY